jgi:ATPase subunit of ABC transporter with duplicated ATPase domains
MLGENGTGKTTFIRMLAGLLKADVKPGEKEPDVGGFSVSYKPQMIAPSFEGSVRALLYAKIKEAYVHPQVRGAGAQGTAWQKEHQWRGRLARLRRHAPCVFYQRPSRQAPYCPRSSFPT